MLAAATFVTFLPSLRGEFLWDDDYNFLDNPKYRGLSPSHLSWMATAFVAGHYHPLTWLTFGLDYVIWGMNPFGYRLTNLLFHVANAVLLYCALTTLLRVSGRAASPWAALIGAAFYAVHPLRVESVAWITLREALADHTRSLELNDGSPDAWWYRGMMQSRLGRHPDAVADYTRSLQLRPGHATTLVDRGTARELSGDTAGAMADLSEALRLKPKASVYLHRASLRDLAGDWRGVVDDCGEAIRLRSGFVDAYVRRGMARLKLGEVSAAAGDFEMALRCAPPGWPQREQIEQALLQARTGIPK